MATKHYLIPACCIAWMLCVGAGIHMLWSYSSRPGEAANSPLDWPAQEIVALDGRRPTLVGFLHPRCPCSRATLSELDKLVRACGDRLATRVIFVKPPGAAVDWDQGELRARAAAIPNVSLIVDDGAAIAAQFASRTSGQVMLYDADGRLRFRGGITAGRGEVGDNDGRLTLTQLVMGPTARTSLATPSEPQGEAARALPVYGCPLMTPEAERVEKELACSR